METLDHPTRWWTSALLGLLVIILIYLGFAFATAATRAPYSDEAWFASPALDLLHTGHMGTTILLPNGMAGKGTLAGIQQHTYWIMPLDPLLEAAWYRAIGFSLMAERTLSIFFGVLVICSWFVLLERLTLSRAVALLGVVFLAIDHIFVYHSADGRMDMMCTALGFAGLASFMLLRERNFGLALLVANIFICASLLTHPNAILAFAGLVFLAIYFDGARLRWRHLAALLPFVVGAALYARYILQDPSDYFAQMHANSSGRFSGFVHPVAAIWLELTQRYLPAYGLSASASSLTKAKILILVGYLGAVCACSADRRFRNLPGTRVLLSLLGIYVVIMTFFNFKLEHYLINVIPIFAALLAVAMFNAWNLKLVSRHLLGLAVAVVCAVQLGTMVYRIAKLDTYHRQYEPAVHFLLSYFPARQIVTGDPSFAFGLGFDRLQQDDTAGYATGSIPQVLVRTSPYAEEQMALFARERPEIASRISKVLNKEMVLVYDHPPYKIYRRR